MTDRLNSDLLPSSHFAVIETVELRPPVGFLTLPEPESEYVAPDRPDTVCDVESDEPNVRHTFTDPVPQYACRTICVRLADHHQPVAGILWITDQDKRSQYRFEALTRFAVGAITHDIHLLVIDLFPPSVRDPQGIHPAIWDQFQKELFELPPGQPFTVASYSATGREKVAYVENVGLGEAIPVMPLFLTSKRYVPCPMEASYQQTWSVFPQHLRSRIENPPPA